MYKKTPSIILVLSKHSETSIFKVPIQEGILEITTEEIKIYNSKDLSSNIDLDNVEAVTPVKENIIRIHYMNKIESNSIWCNVLDYTLDKPKLSSIEICREISKKITKTKQTTLNKIGWIYLKEDESILNTYDNVIINGDQGILYITDMRIIYETKFKIPINAYFGQLISIKEKDNNIITIQCDYPLSTLDNSAPPFFDIILPKDIDCPAVCMKIKDAFLSYDLESQIDISRLAKYYSKMTHNELYRLASEIDETFYEYLKSIAIITFGRSTETYLNLDLKLVLACMLCNWDINLISSISDEELNQRIYAKRYEKLKNFHYYIRENYEQEIDQTKRVQRPDHENLTSDSNYLKNAWSKVNADCDMIENTPSLNNKIIADVLRDYNKRVMILYREWCKDVPLENFKDEYSDEWITYLLKKLDTEQGRTYIIKNNINYEELEEHLSASRKNKATLAKFRAPDHIENKYIYNNCWYDKRRKTWYVEDDDLPEFLQFAADYTPDNLEKMIGRRVWGFKRKKVELFCGFPSIKATRDGGDINATMGYNRNTGQMRRAILYSTAYHILPILRESDTVPELVTKYGKMLARFDEVYYTILGSGNVMELTPKMRRYFEEIYELAKIPLNERVRRAVFCVETIISHSPDVPLGEDFAKPLDIYPDSIYDERLE